jgi:cell volume regulation protein A
MVLTLELLLLGISLLILISILANKFSERLGVPALLIFLVVGMLAGSEGPGGIPFDDPVIAQIIGIIALAYILFSGGLDTRWEQIRPVIGPGIALSTLGVVLTAALLGAFAVMVLGLPPLTGLLLGAVVSSTDAARSSLSSGWRERACRGTYGRSSNSNQGATTPWRSFLP